MGAPERCSNFQALCGNLASMVDDLRPDGERFSMYM